MKKAIYLIGNVGSGKDFLLRGTSLRNLKEIHNDKLVSLYKCGHALSDSRIVVNCAGDEIGPILESKRLLETSGYETCGVFVYTTNEVSKARSQGRGSRTINETIRFEKYRKSFGNIHKLDDIFDGLIIFDNSSSIITEQVKEWLFEVNDNINQFLIDQETSAFVGVSGRQDRGHGEDGGVSRRTKELRGGKTVSSTNSGGLDNRSNHDAPSSAILQDAFDHKAAFRYAKELVTRRASLAKKHRASRGLKESILKRIKKPHQETPPSSQVGFADGGCGITPTGDGGVSEDFDFGIRHPPFTGQRGKNPDTASTAVTPSSVGGFNAGTASTPVNSIEGGTTPISGAAINANKMMLRTRAAKPPGQFYNGAAGGDGTESGSGTPGGATNESRKLPVPPEEADDSISGTPGEGDSIAGTMSEGKRVMKAKMVRTLSRNKTKRKETLHD